MLLKEDIIENIIQCSTCQACKLTNKLGCVPIWQYGDNFDVQSKRILFVGKTARGQYPPACYKNADNYYTGYHVAFWECIRGISEKLKLNWEDIAVTNLIKCNTSDGQDKTTSIMKQNCIVKQRFIQKEIIHLKPTHIVFFSNSNYDTEIKTIFDSIQNVSNTDETSVVDIPCRWKKMPYWEFIAKSNGRLIRVLRSGHPERKDSAKFIEIISDFLQQNPI